MNGFKVTIITPTYNRKDLLPRLYSSLLKQTCKDFQWLIIDDGSIDGTKEVVDEFIPNGFQLEYHWKENGGKHTALNYSHEYIKGKIIVIVDSDDALEPDAVQMITDYWKKYDGSDIKQIVFQKGDLNYEKKSFDNSFRNSDTITTWENAINDGMSGDHCETVRSIDFKQFQFPEYKNEKFIGEAWMWKKIADMGKILLVNHVIYLAEYQQDGLSRLGRKYRIKNPLGGMEHAKIYLDKRLNLKIRCKQAILVICYGKFARCSMKKIRLNVDKPCILYSMYVPGCLLWLLYRWKYRIE